MNVNYARRWWPHYCLPPREYLNEAQILEDMYSKTKESPRTLESLLATDRDGMIRVHRKSGHAIINHYGLDDVEYPMPEGETPFSLSLRIFLALWDRFREEGYFDE